MGLPTKERWPLLASMPEYPQLSTLQSPLGNQHRHHHSHHHHHLTTSTAPPLSGQSASNLEKWYYSTIGHGQTPPSVQHGATGNTGGLASLGAEGYKLLSALLEYDPEKRLTAEQALEHPFFSTGDVLTTNCFEGLRMEYPNRRVSQDDNDIRTGSLPGTKRSGLPDDSIARASKRVKE